MALWIGVPGPYSPRFNLQPKLFVLRNSLHTGSSEGSNELNEFMETFPKALKAHSMDQEWIRIHASGLQWEVVRTARIYKRHCNVLSLLSDFVSGIYIERLYGHGAR